MNDAIKRAIGEAVADALGPGGQDVLYDPETFHDPEKTSEDIRDIIVRVVVQAITEAEARS